MTRRGPRLWAAWLACFACLVLSACGTTPRDGGEAVTLRDIASGDPRPAPGNADAPAPEAAVFMRTLTLPLERSVEEAWAMASAPPAPPLSLGVWQSNGVRLGVIPLDAWATFEGTLPRVLASTQTGLYASAEPSPIVSSPRLVRPIRLDLTVPPMAPREAWARRGRLRLLAAVTDATRDPAARRLSLTPHHAIPQPLVLPEALAHVQPAGVTFEQLALRFDLPPGALLVLGLDRPWDRVPPEPPSDDSSPDTPSRPAEEPPGDVAAASPPPDAPTPEAEPLGGPVVDDPDAPDAADAETERVPRPGPPMPDVPPHLGRALFTAERLGRPVQRLVVISVVPLDTTDDATPRP